MAATQTAEVQSHDAANFMSGDATPAHIENDTPAQDMTPQEHQALQAQASDLADKLEDAAKAAEAYLASTEGQQLDPAQRAELQQNASQLRGNASAVRSLPPASLRSGLATYSVAAAGLIAANKGDINNAQADTIADGVALSGAEQDALASSAATRSSLLDAAMRKGDYFDSLGDVGYSKSEAAGIDLHQQLQDAIDRETDPVKKQQLIDLRKREDAVTAERNEAHTVQAWHQAASESPDLEARRQDWEQRGLLRNDYGSNVVGDNKKFLQVVDAGNTIEIGEILEKQKNGEPLTAEEAKKLANAKEKLPEIERDYEKYKNLSQEERNQIKADAKHIEDTRGEISSEAAPEVARHNAQALAEAKTSQHGQQAERGYDTMGDMLNASLQPKEGQGFVADKGDPMTIALAQFLGSGFPPGVGNAQSVSPDSMMNFQAQQTRAPGFVRDPGLHQNA